MRIALIEWTQGGHHELHLKTAATALASAGHEVWILHPQPALIRDEILATLPELADRLKPYALEPQGRLVESRDARLKIAGKWLSVRRALRALDTTAPFDLVFFMFLDEFLAPLISIFWLDSAFRFPWAGIYMQPLFRLQASKLGRRREFFRRDHLLRSRCFKGAMVLDEASIPWLQERFSRSFVAMPEYGDIAEPDLQAQAVQELLAFAGGRPIIGAFGSLSKRKGLLNLLRAAPRIGGKDAVIAIAGNLETSTFSPSELLEIDMATVGLGNRCWYRPGPIPSDGAFSALMSVSSVCYIAYEGWVFSSGLQSIAAQFGVPCVVANTGIMAERAESFHTGLAIDPSSPDAAAAAIRSLLTEKLPLEGFKRYSAQHTIEAFRTTLCDFVEGVCKP